MARLSAENTSFRESRPAVNHEEFFNEIDPFGTFGERVTQ
jgi:hypothetical protein